MNKRILELWEQSADKFPHGIKTNPERFAELIIRECVNKIETYEIYVGCSPAGELACEWTYNSLKSIRDDIKEEFGIE